MCALPQAAVAAAIKVRFMQREPGTGQRQREELSPFLRMSSGDAPVSIIAVTSYLGAPAHSVLRLDRRAGGAKIAAEREKS